MSRLLTPKFLLRGFEISVLASMVGFGITLLYGNDPERMLPGKLTESMPQPSAEFKVDGTAGYTINDMVLVTNGGETELAPGMCAGFAAGSGDSHQLVNPGPEMVEFLEIGDRTPGDDVLYPDDDLAAKLGPDGKWHYYRKDGTPY